MSLQKYNPNSIWDVFNSRMPSVFDDLDTFMPIVPSWMHKNIEVVEKEDSYVAKAPVYGVEPKDVEVSVNNGILTVSGEAEKEETDKKDKYHSKMETTFHYQVSLPRSVDEDKVTAKVKHGVVTVTIPKSKSSSGKKITVTAE